MNKTDFSIGSFFFLEALASALVIPRFPDIKNAVEMSELALGVGLSGLPVGAFVGFIASIKFGARIKSSWAFPLFGLFTMLGFTGLTIAPNAWGFFLVLIFAGISTALLDIAKNEIALIRERNTGRRILSRLHAIFSMGSITGLFVGGLLAEFQVNLMVQGVISSIFFILSISILFFFCLFSNGKLNSLPVSSVSTNRFFGLKLFLVPLLVVFLLSFFIETLTMDWAAIYLRAELKASPFIATLPFMVFSVTTTLMLLGGDKLIKNFNGKAILLISCAISSASLVLCGFATSPLYVIIFISVCGAGAALIHPAVISMMAGLPGGVNANLAKLNLWANLCMFAYSPIVGAIAGAFGVGNTFAIIGFVCLAAVVGIIRMGLIKI